MCLRRYNYFPLVFRWHGSLFRVRAVERCWAQAVGLPLRGRARRLWFRVRAAADPPIGRRSQAPSRGQAPTGGQAISRVEVYQDLVTNTWHLDRILAPTATGDNSRAGTREDPCAAA